MISSDGFSEIGNFSLGTDGKGRENLIVKTAGMRNREKADDLKFDENGNPISSDHLYMNGSEIFNFTIEAVPPLIEDTLKKNDILFEDCLLYTSRCV